ncbi:MAG: NeuD/PglB/VioB family sugar acetyltransferase [Magnetococcales bacterium]|nr:NeuD/PglB/VioB family sugar acetyltransferase [Magnetococcales bacterium]MBF0157283.1 NeuD/PglB/VioB family sugar acetyltransferase [Magnetococcales bacterium]
MLEEIVIIGGGGHGKVVIDLIESSTRLRIVGIVDHAIPQGTKIMGYPVLGSDDELEEIYSQGVTRAAVGVGSVGDNGFRAQALQYAHVLGFTFEKLVHPSAYVSPHAQVGAGCQIMAGSVIQPGSIIGPHTVINTATVIEHDCRIGRNVFTGTAARVCGNVTVGDDGFLGAGCLILQSLQVGPRALVGAGSVVVQNIKDGARVKGVPAKPY